MFLNTLLRRNPEFLNAIVKLHQSGDLPANCYAIDADAVAANASMFANAGRELGLEIFVMTKQFGRNPDVCGVLEAAGLTDAVGVDLECAEAAHAAGLRVGHLGHLVQIPRHESLRAAELQPRYWTVFSLEKANEASAALKALGGRRAQDVLLRVIEEGDEFYPGHEGGFAPGDLVAAANAIDRLPHVRVAGVTTFPATLFDPEARRARPTSNRHTLLRSAELLRASGRDGVVVNAPGTTSLDVLENLAAEGATQVEPGHGLTGTTPAHAFSDLREQPAIAYVSEVSHHWNGSAYVFGGGLYADPILGDAPTNALVTDGGRPLDEEPVMSSRLPSANAIDYYATVADPHHRLAVGSTVVFGFRAQAFVTRAMTAAITGVRSGSPVIQGIWPARGAGPVRGGGVGLNV